MLNQKDYPSIKEEQLKFGIQIILSELYKILLIYYLAFLLDCIVLTLVVHITFFLLRQVCLGYHFKNLYVCLIWSTIAFPIATNYITNLTLNFSSFYLYVGILLPLSIIYILGPRGTENQPIINQSHRSYLRKKIIIRLLLLITVFYFSPLKIQIFIIYGVILEVFMLILQILKERVVNV